MPQADDRLGERNDKAKSGFRPTTIFQVQLGVMFSETEEETIIADLLSNRYFRVNATGAYIWRKAKTETKTFSDVVENLSEEYKLDPKVAEEVVQGFLEDVVEAGLLVSSGDREQVTHSP
jgi:hypothetical protein